MIGILKRDQLVRKGFACAKTRRRQDQSELVRFLEESSWTKAAVIALFALGLGLLIFSGQGLSLWETIGDAATGKDEYLMESFLVSILILVTASIQLAINHPQAFAKNSRVCLIFGAIFIQLFAIKILTSTGEQHAAFVESSRLILPFSFAPLVLSILLGRNHGIFAAVFATLWGAYLLDQRSFIADFLPISLITGFLAVFMTRHVTRRSQFLKVGLVVGVATLIMGLALGFFPLDLANPGKTNWKSVGFLSLIAIGNGLFVASVVGGILPFLEGAFKITTSMSWLELSDLNHPLLRRMTREAPGTYNHSMRVADLAEAAAEAIGADAQKCRVCCYFHDIGKLVKPEYFSENITDFSDPHQDLSPTMSALIIIAHVKEGVNLALRHKLNQEIIDVIRQHHGTSLVHYFYHRALEQRRDALERRKSGAGNEEDVSEVQEETFRYPGPRPRFKESGIIHLADSLESASRSLEKPTPQKIDQLVRDIIDARIEDGQLNHCDLTLQDINKLADAFRATLQSMLHARIAYPRREDTEREKEKVAEMAAANERRSGRSSPGQKTGGARSTTQAPAVPSTAEPKARENGAAKLPGEKSVSATEKSQPEEKSRPAEPEPNRDPRQTSELPRVRSGVEAES